MSILKDCEDLLKRAWKEVKCTSKKSEKEKEVLLRTLLDDIGSKVDFDGLESFDKLKIRLANIVLRRNIMFTGWTSCKQLYESLLMLITSNYEKYELLSIGNAKEYFEKAIPLYCKLSGSKPPVLNKQKTNDLINGDILYKLKQDIPNIDIIMDIDGYKKIFTSGLNRIVIAAKGNYAVTLSCSTLSKGMDIGNTGYKLTIMNIKTKRELKVQKYSDIKRILK